jgi:hypothetical protein
MSRARWISLLLATGCALDNPPFVEPSVGLDLDLDLLTARLAPSAAIVNAEPGGPDRAFPGLTAWALEDGGTAGVVWRGTAFDEFYGTYVTAVPGWFRTTASGQVLTFDAGGTGGVSLGDEVLVWDCPNVGLTDPTAGFVRLEQVVEGGGAAPCDGVSGVGATRDRVLHLDRDLVTVYLHTIDRGLRRDTVSVLGPAPVFPANTAIALIYEPSPDVAAYVVSGASGVSFVDETGASVAATGLDGSDLRAWVGADASLRISTSVGLYRADPATGEATRLADVPPSPTGTAWVAGFWHGGAYAEAGPPNDGAPALIVPSAMAVRYATDAGFEVFEPPLTPCCDPAACREMGESYLLGGIGGSADPVAVYDLWSWIGDDSKFTHVGIARADLDACP